MAQIKKILVNVLVLMLLLIPLVSLAENTDTGLVTCTSNCGWNDLMNMINKIIHFILFDLAIPVAAIMFAFAGFKMVTAGGEAAHARTEAKEIFFNTVIGLLFAVGAFIIIRTILSILGYQGSWLGFSPIQ